MREKCGKMRKNADRFYFPPLPMIHHCSVCVYLSNISIVFAYIHHHSTAMSTLQQRLALLAPFPPSQHDKMCVPRYQPYSCSDCEVQHRTILPALQTISSAFWPCGRPGGLKLPIKTMAANKPRLLARNLTRRHQDTHCMCVCPTAPNSPSPYVPDCDIRAVGGAGTKR
jgi:hypothetical protein